MPISQKKLKNEVLKPEEKRKRERMALELRKAGMTYQQIADKIGWKNGETASRAVKRALDRITDEPADDLRKLMEERLGTMLMVLWPDIQRGDNQAIAQGLKIMDRQAALRGLEAPKKFEVNATSEHVLTIGGPKEAFMAALQAHRGEIPQPVLGAPGDAIGGDRNVIDVSPQDA